MNRWSILLLILLLAGCEKEESDLYALGENVSIVGTWVQQQTEQEQMILKRAAGLNDNLYGFIIREDGTFVERKNAGWCGTPPISYANFDGSWSALSDSLIEITVGYWGGTMNYQIRITSLEQDELKIRYLYGEDRAESK
jgi:hypothetical protein